MINPSDVERYLDAARLDEIAEDELDTIKQWVSDSPEYAAKYIALIRQQASED